MMTATRNRTTDEDLERAIASRGALLEILDTAGDELVRLAQEDGLIDFDLLRRRTSMVRVHHHAMLGLWRELAALPEEEFVQKRTGLIAAAAIDRAFDGLRLEAFRAAAALARPTDAAMRKRGEDRVVP